MYGRDISSWLSLRPARHVLALRTFRFAVPMHQVGYEWLKWHTAGEAHLPVRVQTLHSEPSIDSNIPHPNHAKVGHIVQELAGGNA